MTQPDKLRIGDRVSTKSGITGTIAMWHRTKRSLVLDLDDDTLSDWIPTSSLATDAVVDVVILPEPVQVTEEYLSEVED